jgi:hypothetical protein
MKTALITGIMSRLARPIGTGNLQVAVPLFFNSGTALKVSAKSGASGRIPQHALWVCL